MYDEIAAGGMATVHLGRLLGPVGFSRTVAIKRLHPHLAKDPEFTAAFLDEARLAARIRHPNVVPTLDVVAAEGELFIVMDYVHGESLAKLLKIAELSGARIPLGIVGNLMSGMLQGLHAAHEARSDRGELLGIVHRDVSPQNLLVGSDGMPRLVDFGVAKAMGRISSTKDGRLKGKIGYMAPEQIVGGKVTRRSDMWGAGSMLWYALTSKKLFTGSTETQQILAVVNAHLRPPSTEVAQIGPEVDAVVMRALSRDPKLRFQSAAEMAEALEKAIPPATQREVAAWIDEVAGKLLSQRAVHVAAVESVSMEPPDSDESPRASSAALDEPEPRGSEAVPQGGPAGQGQSRPAEERVSERPAALAATAAAERWSAPEPRLEATAVSSAAGVVVPTVPSGPGPEPAEHVAVAPEDATRPSTRLARLAAQALNADEVDDTAGAVHRGKSRRTAAGIAVLITGLGAAGLIWAGIRQSGTSTNDAAAPSGATSTALGKAATEPSGASSLGAQLDPTGEGATAKSPGPKALPTADGVLAAPSASAVTKPQHPPVGSAAPRTTTAKPPSGKRDPLYKRE